MVSPFLHPRTLKIIGKWGGDNVKRHLLSTHAALSELINSVAVTKDFETRYLAAPNEMPVDDDEGEADKAQTEPLGLHAKVIAIKTAAKCVIWMGSANATEAAWSGRNFEVVAEIHSSPKELDALETLFDRSLPFVHDGPAPKQDEITTSLDAARLQVSQDWCVTQTWSDGCLSLRRRASFHPVDLTMSIRVGLLDGVPQLWPVDQDEIHFQPCELEQCSELLRIQLHLSGKSCEWLQVAPFPEGLPAKRDEAVMFRYLSSHGFMAWLRAILTGADGLGGGAAWDEKPQTKRRMRGQDSTFRNSSGMLPSLEDVLKAWAAEPDGTASALHHANSVLERYAQQLNEIDALEDMDREALVAFRIWWEKVIGPILQRSKL